MKSHALDLLSRGAWVSISSLALLTLSACLKPKTLTCDTGNLCPDGMKCVTADALKLSHRVCVPTDCGDGVLNTSKNGVREECDDGAETATCNFDCTIARCGDGKLNRSAGEQCDPGIDAENCNSDCTIARCGDGKLNKNHTVEGKGFKEQCDDGGESENCNDDCTIASCGDGKTNRSHTVEGTSFKEQCDDGGETEGCNADCTYSRCGDGKLNKAHTVEKDVRYDLGEADFKEQCDDGGESARCNKDCTVARCGDHKLNKSHHVSPTQVERCDDGGRSATCSETCQPAQCGNGVLDEGEECDQGAETATCTLARDEASPYRCTISRCGDGYVNGVAEACDPGIDPAGCNTDCTLSICGDGKLNKLHTVEGKSFKEQCDDGGESATCNLDCTVARCGDGKLNAAANEKCDPGIDPAGCNADCTLAVCGDGKLNKLHTVEGKSFKEQCDDGGESATCNVDCTIASCGDGKVNETAREKCDPGIDPAGCNSDCTLSICGDGKLNKLHTVEGKSFKEQCDDGGNSAGCNADCSFSRCGDRYVNGAAAEVCDNGNNLGCGTCNASCTERLSPLPASGKITPVAKALLADGDLFILDDGVSQAVFELDFDDKVVRQRVRVDLSAAQDDSAVEVGNAIKSAIDSLKPPLRLSATVDSETGVVTLVNRIGGSFGDRPIVSTVSASGFSVDGMSGGVARGCSANTPCGLNGDCVPGTACVEGMCQIRNYTLAVQTSGEGSGAVTADVGALSCGSICSASYPANTLVDLRAIASDSSVFKNWSGDSNCSTADVCPVLMDSDKSITATFSPSTYLLTVEVRGSGSVASGGTKIQCPGTCSASFTKSKEVTLTATPGATDGGTVTITWDGACNAASGSTCTLTMDAAKTVTVTFGN